MSPRLERAGDSGLTTAMGGSCILVERRGSDVLLELRRGMLGTAGTAGISSSIGRGFFLEASEPIRLGSSMPPIESMAGRCGGVEDVRGIGLAYDSPAVEKDTASSSCDRVRDRLLSLLVTASGRVTVV